MTDSLVLVSDNVLLPTGARVAMTPAALLIDGNRIARVATGITRQAALSALSAPPDARIDDLGSRWLTPAFIDGHTHLSLHSLRGLTVKATTETNVVEDLFYRFEHGLQPSEVRAFVRMGAYEALIHGTGLVYDHYFHALEVAEAVTEVGLTAAVAPTVQDLGGPFAHAADAGLVDTETLDSPAWAARGVAAMIGPHAMDTVSPALWEKITALAARRGLPVHVHVAQSLEEVDRVAARTGRSPVDELVASGVLDAAPTTLAVHMIYASSAELARLPTGRTLLTHCPQSALVFGHPARLDAWERSGLRYLVGSDTAASNDALDVRTELRVVLGQAALAATFCPDYERFLATGDLAGARGAWAVRGAARKDLSRLFDPAALLAAVTSIPGRAHPRLHAGELAAGALANVAVWDEQHPVFWPASDPLRSLALADAAPALLHLMTNGTWRGERGRFAASLRESAEYQAHRHEASARLRERLERIGMA